MEKGSPRVSLAQRIKSIRKSKNMTLSEVEANCGVTASTISKIENGTISPTYANLLRLSKGLGVDIVQLVNEDSHHAPRTRRSVTRFGEGPVHSIGSHEYRLLCTDLADKKMLPMLATIHAKSLNEVQRPSERTDENGYFSHEGEEILFVYCGEVVLYTEHYTPVRLASGDCAYIDSTMGHVCIRGSDEDALVFWVCSDGSSIEQMAVSEEKE